MLKCRWNAEKNQWLEENRNITFDDLINEGKIIDIVQNISSNHPDQERLIILYKQKLYAVPFVREKNGGYFLKTAFRSRQLDKQYVTYLLND